MKSLIIIIRVAITVALAFGAKHFGIHTFAGAFLAFLAVLYGYVTLVVAVR